MVGSELAVDVGLLDAVTTWSREAKRSVDKAMSISRADRAAALDASRVVVEASDGLLALASEYGQALRASDGGAGQRLPEAYTARWGGQPLASLLQDDDFVNAVRQDWQANRPATWARRGSGEPRPYDALVAAELGLLVDLGVPAAQAWRIVRLVLPPSVDRSYTARAAGEILRGSDVNRLFQGFYLGSVPDLAAMAARLNALAIEDPNTPQWQRLVARALKSPVVRVAASVFESANGYAGDNGSLASIAIGAVCGAFHSLDDLTEPERILTQLLGALVDLTA